MPDCVNCLQIISSDCIRSEEKLSFDHSNLSEVIKKLDEKNAELVTVLTANVDKQWITEEHKYITEYIQDIINKVDTLIKAAPASEPKFRIPSDITGSDEKTLLQLLTIIVRELDALKKKVNSQSSSIYIPNV